MSDEELMQQALLVAHDALASGDVPVGAIIVNKDGKIIASGHNERELHKDPTAHAESVFSAMILKSSECT